MKKKFKDLVFEPHDLSIGYPEDIRDTLGFKNMVQARIEFDNGNTISVIGGGPTYGDGTTTFEVMDHEGEVHGYLSEHEVTEIMLKAQDVWMGGIKKLKIT
jgi:hypothetical protein